eukprot:3743418-Amphidinium_carterae.1
MEKARNAWMDLLTVLVSDVDARARAYTTVNLNGDAQAIPIQPDAMIVMADLKEQQRELLVATLYQ